MACYLSPINNSLQHFRNYLSLDKRLVDHKHFLYFLLYGNFLQHFIRALLFLFNTLLYSFLGPLCSHTKELGIGPGLWEDCHGLEVLLLFCDDSGFLLFVDIWMGMTVTPHLHECIPHIQTCSFD